jgi:putative NADH-flavin reductase
MPDIPLDPFKDLLGVDFTPERLQQNLDSFKPILEEIRKLRALDLADVHPAVIFEPTAAYRRGPGK